MELRSHTKQGRPPQITRRSVAAGALFVALKGALTGPPTVQPVRSPETGGFARSAIGADG